MYKDKKVIAVITAAGSGTRIGFDKMLYKIDDKTIIETTVEKFDKNPFIDEIIVLASLNIQDFEILLKSYKKVKHIIKGSTTRALSVKNAIDIVTEDSLVCIHDGARPFVNSKVINEAIENAYIYKAAIPCVKVKDTIKVEENGFVKATPNRDALYITQTPQVFHSLLYKELLEKTDITHLTDDSQLFEENNIKVKITNGSYENYKITTIDDLKRR